LWSVRRDRPWKIRKNHFESIGVGRTKSSTPTDSKTPRLPLLESRVLYFCPPTDGKEAHLEHDEFNKVNYVPEVHFHDGAEDHVVESDVDERPEQAIRQVLGFVRKKLTFQG
jgi:hypothetical protein